MREIKFRAWDKDKQEIIPWEMLKVMPMELLCTPNDWVSNVMQFAGLLDKNGTEIYENDIVAEERSGEKIIFVVESLDDYLGVRFADKNYIYGHDLDNASDLEVIGNIYSNPELAGRTE